jgi:SAM-dependent methyltransferase
MFKRERDCVYENGHNVFSNPIETGVMALSRFTGERLIPGMARRRIELDHLARYEFATGYIVGKTVLDIACGVGYGAPILIEAGAKAYTGVDISVESIDYARELYLSGRCHLDVGDICTYEAKELFDVVICFETIEHVGRYHAAIENLYGFLSNDGTALVSSPNRKVTSPQAASIDDRPANRFHTQEFTPEELLYELRRVGFGASIGSVFGQRLRRPLLQKIARLAHRDDIFSSLTSSRVRRLGGRIPRYFIVVARKPPRGGETAYDRGQKSQGDL